MVYLPRALDIPVAHHQFIISINLPIGLESLNQNPVVEVPLVGQVRRSVEDARATTRIARITSFY